MGRHALAIVCVAAIGVAAASGRASAQAVRLRGQVFDSVASLPLVGARIELVSLQDRAHVAFVATSDSLGRFLVPGVGRGRYIAGFLHPMLDSLGLALSQRWLDVGADSEVRLDLAVPAPERIYRALCNLPPAVKTASDSAGVVLGYVLSAHTLAPVGGVTVLAQWAELTIYRGGIQQQVMSRSGVTENGGWFAICGVPAPADVVIRAISGADSSGAIEIRVPPTRVARRNLYLAAWSPQTTSNADSSGTLVSRSGSATPRRMTLTGWVRTEDGVPIAHAQVRLYGSDVVVATDGEGAFQLDGIPGGTQTLQTRALGFVPDERAVDITDQHLPIIVGLTGVRQFLDTVHVRAARLDISNIVGFESRRKLGSGRFFSASDLQRLHPREFTDILRHAPSLELVSGQAGGYTVRMRGDSRSCNPAMFLDGKQLVTWELADVNGLVRPEDIAGLEVYTPAMTPVEFRTRDGCGTILIWTRAPDRGPKRR